MDPSTKNGDDSNSNQQNLDQIREILFGNQSRDFETRFQAISDQLAESIGGLQSLVRERTDAVSQKMDREIQTLHKELASLRQSSQDRDASLDHKLKNTENELRQQLGSLTETLSAAERAIRNDAENGLKELRQQLVSQMESMREQFERELNSVSKASVSRHSFRDALIELSARFDDDSE